MDSEHPQCSDFPNILTNSSLIIEQKLHFKGELRMGKDKEGTLVGREHLIQSLLFQNQKEKQQPSYTNVWSVCFR